MKKTLFKIFVVLITFGLLILQNYYVLASNSKEPNKTKLIKVTVNNGKASIKWKKIKNVDGYSVYMSTLKNGKYKKIKNIYGSKNITYIKKNLDYNKEYYFKIKTFKLVKDKKIYSKSSNIRSGGGIIASIVLTSTSDNESRNTNLRIACKKINGIILKPGQKFVWSKVIGRLTETNGYRKAIAYVNGNNRMAYGGGVCQVSTNLYQCVKQSKMKLVERHEHGKAITYIENGEDATVSQGYKDFIFKNNKSYTIKIIANSWNNVTICQFYKIGDK